MRYLKSLFSLALLASVSPLVGTGAHAQTFNQLIGFGDSSLDDGYFRYVNRGNGSEARYAAARANGGSITPSAGLMNTDFLAAAFGLGLAPSSAPGGGTNFAVSGAKNDSTNLGGGTSPSTVQQISNYLASTGGWANPNALYILRSGGNDRSGFISNYQATHGGASPPNGSFIPFVQPSLAALEGAIQQLSAAGARYLILPTYFITNTTLTAYTQQTWNDLAARGVRFIPADSASLSQYVIANPAAFGFTSVTPTVLGGAAQTSACHTPIGFNGSGAAGFGLYCIPSTTPAGTGASATAFLNSTNSLQTSLFSDDQHLSPAGQKIEADYFYGLVVAPSQISFLAEAPLKTREGVISSIYNQIPLSQSTPGAFHGWVSGDVSWLKMTNNSAGFPDDPGTPLATTAGFDYAITSNWLAGVAFSGLTTKQTFSLGGDYRQDEFAVSVYTAYRRNGLWANAIGSWGTMHDTVNRVVPLGITTQSNQGTTSGNNGSLAGEIGYDFSTPIGGRAPATPGLAYKAPVAAQPLVVTHGPVVGVILQQVYVDGFTETNPSGAPTALTFSSQTRNSAVSELGYQASIRYGIWEPYAKVVWDHEFAGLNRLVGAALTSIVAPGFSMPAVILGRDWATGTFGTRVRLGSNLSAYGALIAEVGQNNVTTYGGQIGINYAFNPPPVAAKY
jgi:outer membrane lipase/esterase